MKAFILILLSLYTFLAPQPTDRWIVQLEPDGYACFEAWWSQTFGERSALRKDYLPVYHTVAIELPQTHLASLQKLECVVAIRPDRKIEWRDTEPNDPRWIHQGDMTLIGMPDAWDISTGGLTTRGDTIVVAVIDDGFQINHPDLRDNIWHNYHEIPDDNIDNDGNGYVDDVDGWNVQNNTDTHPVAKHGTQVIGVIGAKGNNNTGVAGVNWNVKLMLLSDADFESDLIRAYEYVLTMRRLYKETNGAKGAFVVACNLSAGVNGEFAVDHPEWCAMYDALGNEGILSITAAPNNEVNVDTEGDMPTTCGSSMMIAVTNVDLTDILLETAGFGPVSIDIGAPGHGTVTTSNNNNYADFIGTSAAAPHVAGTIALMYSTPCTGLLETVDENPRAVAVKIRDIIYETASPNNTLDEITVTGKRLQTDAAMEFVSQDCMPDMDTRIQITGTNPNPSNGESIEVEFEIVSPADPVIFAVYSVHGVEVGRGILSEDNMAAGILNIQTHGLPAGIYLVHLRSGNHKATRKIFVY